MDISVGQIIEKPYPFTFFEDEFSSGWNPGCKKFEQEGPEVFEGHCLTDISFSCDREGLIVLEVLSVARMPGRYMDRVIYSKRYVNPDGGEDYKKQVCVATIKKFESWIGSPRSPIPIDYEVLDDEAA